MFLLQRTNNYCMVIIMCISLNIYVYVHKVLTQRRSTKLKFLTPSN